MGSRRDGVNTARLVVVIADGDPERCRQLAEAVREFGVEDVAVVHSLEPAIERLRQEPADVLVCGEQLLDQHGAVLLAAARRISPATRTLLLPRDDGPKSSGSSAGDGSELLEARSLLQMALHGAAAPQGAFWCKVPDLSLPDILQLYHQLRRSVTVLVSGNIAGRIRLEAGQLVHAECDDLVGVAALSRLLEADSGLVRTEASIFDGTTTISAPFHRLLLDAMDLIDARRQVARAQPREPSVPPPEPAVQLLFEPPEAPRIELPEATFFATVKAWPNARAVLLVSAAGLLAALSLYAVVTNVSRHSEPAAPQVVRYASEPAAALAAAPGALPAETMAAKMTAADRTPPERAPAENPPSENAAAQPTPAPTAPAKGPVAELVPVPEARADEPSRAVEGSAHAAAPTGDAASFVLHLTSTPSGASVTEDGKLLGTTPLNVRGEPRGEGRGPRRFVLSARGYQPYTLEQTEWGSDLDVTASLTPASAVPSATPPRAAAPALGSSPLEIRLER